MRLKDEKEKNVKFYCVGLLLISLIIDLLILPFSALREKIQSRLEVRILTFMDGLWRNDLHSVAKFSISYLGRRRFSICSNYVKQIFHLKVGELSKAENY